MAKWWNYMKDWEAEQMAVLQDPSLVDNMAPGWRRSSAKKLAALPVLERDEMRRMMQHWRGPRFWSALLKCEIALIIFGVLLKLSILPNVAPYKLFIGLNGVAFFLLLTLVNVWFNYSKYIDRKRKVVVLMGGLSALGGIYGAVIAKLMGDGSWEHYFALMPRLVITITLVMWLFFGIPVIVIALLRGQRFKALNAQLQRDTEHERMARQHSETQLRLLRAQIEPHFLFNTLGAVQQLAEGGAPRAAELTAHLIDFLRASMDQMREEQATLGQEFALVASYLNVMQVRMGSRLSFNIDLAPDLTSVTLPSMIVLTLAENAIKHGLEPAIGGGVLNLTAERDQQAVRIHVRDTGVGLSDLPGQGTGLANVRDRLKLMFGERASLSLGEVAGEPGVLAEIVIQQEPQA